MADLVLDDVVEDLDRREQQAPVERHRTPGRARRPARPLAADRQAGVAGAGAGGGGVEAVCDLVARGPTVEALQRRPRLALRDEQDGAAPVDALAPPLRLQ